MRTLEYARQQGREYRRRLGLQTDGLLERVERFILATYDLEVVTVNATVMRDSRGEVRAGATIIPCDERLSPAERLELLAHELGHLALHARLTDSTVPYDPILGSAYADTGPGAIARYSDRMFEEAQAGAFATEFLCPSDEAFRLWRRDPAATATTVAAKYAISTDLARLQLANALHRLALEGESHQETPVERPADGASDTSAADGAHAAAPPRECDPRQLEAARFLGAPALVDAGPGTGKTTTLVRRIRFLLEECGAHPREILVLTFSNEAVDELRGRIVRAFGDDVADQATIATFHGFGMNFLHYHGAEAGLPTDFSLLDEGAQAELVSGILGLVPCDRLLSLRSPDDTVAAVLQHIGHCKDRLRDCDALAEEIARWDPQPEEADACGRAHQLLDLYRAYESAKAEAARVDFADLIMLPICILERRPDIAAAYREKYPWVLVDEFQDVSRATSRLLRNLCGPENPPWVVGDARQAIYRFRGAAPENVAQFATDFPGARTFELEVNYRSCDAVIRAANALAALMGAGDAGPESRERWWRGSDQTPLGEAPVRIAVAASDHAERVGIAQEVTRWIATGEVAPGDIAVLARRNVDVREIVLALSRLGVRAMAGGLLTAEGAAGDLAAAVALADGSAGGVPRVTWALARAEHAPAAVNAAVERLLALHVGVAPQELPALDAPVVPIVAEVQRLQAMLAAERSSSDGFSTLAAFLFDAGRYLRRLLDGPDSAERAMGLVEVVSALSLAAAYRVTHPDRAPPEARVGFADQLRRRLTETTPLPITPRPRRDAVLVMTCHASKGLEFPCAVVAGQTVPKTRSRYTWLPPAWRPMGDEDLEQGDALLFVGVTRGQRAALVSYPTSAGGGPRGRQKQVVRLLERWRALPGHAMLTWDAVAPPAPEVRAGPIWGGRRPATLKLGSIDADTCALRTYLEDYLGASFAGAERPLYPAFVAITRRAGRRVIELANARGQMVGTGEADDILDGEWPAREFRDHPHVSIYREAARRMVRGLATAYAPPAGAVIALDPEVVVTGSADELVVRLDLVGHFRDAGGQVQAISFRPESLTIKSGAVNWSDLSTGKRISFVLLERATPGIRPRLFSGADGQVVDFRWSTRKDSLPNETAKVIAQIDALGRLEFTTTVSSFTCDDCRIRVSCPHWIGALA
jgi:DNA helicase II / ATP-dependent DNA helicase PcrA